MALQGPLIDKMDLLARIWSAWDELRSLYAGLDATALTTPPAGGGWSIKDELAHITAYERAILGRLGGLAWHDALGVDEATYEARQSDALNTAIYQRERDRPLEEVLADLASVHAELMATVEALSEEELGLQLEPDRPHSVLEAVEIRTAIHYRKHFASIRALREAAGG